MVRQSDSSAIIECGHFSIFPQRRQLIADGCRPSPGGGDLLPEAFNRVAQSVILGLESRGLVLQSVAQFDVLLALLRDLLLQLLNGLDDGGGQLAIGNAIGTIFVVLPFDQRQPVPGCRSLDRVVQRCRQCTIRTQSTDFTLRPR
jgi:hypothetical protein